MDDAGRPGNLQHSISSISGSRILSGHLPPNVYTSPSKRRFGTGHRQELTASILDNAHGFPYSRKLEAHKSCINALTFSSGDGRFLASGGDDLRILLWDFHQNDVKIPTHALRGPKGNIFCLNFSATNRYIFSGGTCERIYQYDISALGTPMAHIEHAGSPDNIYRSHNESIRALACHPIQDDIFMSASDDGSIIRHDIREGTGRQTSTDNTIQAQCEVTGVQYHPTIEHLFASSDSSGRVLLHDARMAFGARKERSEQGIVQRYNTKLTRRSSPRLSNPESSSITFDKNGSKLAVTFLHYLPTIYAVSDPNPIAVLSGANLPDGTPNPPNERTYCNSCTMKHGSFGGPGLDTDDMFAGGSDDFRVYIWKIPPITQLTSQRREYSADQWIASGLSVDSQTIAFTKGRDEPKVIPTEIATPFCRLTGHNSIVNTTIFHPYFLHVATSGVERNIILHSPTPSSPCTQNLQRSPADVRQLNNDEDEHDRSNYLAAILSVGHSTVGDVDDESEAQTLSLFDHIIREEGVGDVFTYRHWTSSDSEENSSNNPEEEDSDPDSDMVQ
ncbi:WD40 repeat-like protein [Pholiota conissans]|uniref:WD40 repeat-like protein n=1 Tax=Pholiota conissans TaxID=109636 RepID=A0A9P5Z9P4_9AGAR|nr:WD40 repeat-like protein [Pholiota conissans]